MISNEFINEVAMFTDGKIKKVVINGIYEIITFSLKQVTTNVLSMQYLVPFGAVAAINKIELKDELNQVISSNDVYVPITSDTVISQSIRISEV